MSIALEFEVAVLYLCSLLVSGRGVDVSAAEQEGYLDCFLLRVLPDPTNIHSQLAQLPDMFLVDKLCLRMLSLIKNDPHHSLPSPYWAIYFRVNLINRN